MDPPPQASGWFDQIHSSARTISELVRPSPDLEPLRVFPRELIPELGPPIFSPEQVRSNPRVLMATVPSEPRAFILPPEIDPSSFAPAAPTTHRPQATLGDPLVKPVPSESRTRVPKYLPDAMVPLWQTIHPFLARLEIRDEYLMWWMQNDNVPALATATSPNGSGALGDPSTVTLFDDRMIDRGGRQGYRLRGLFWIDAERTWGIGGGFFFLDQKEYTDFYSSADYPNLARPYYSLNANREDAVTVAAPGVRTGVLQIESSSAFWGIEANLLRRIPLAERKNLDLLFGYRYLSLEERLRIDTNTTAGTQASDPAGTQIMVTDRFRTQNDFNGGLIGMRYEHHWRRVSADIRGSIAIGTTTQLLEIDGSQTRIQPGQSIVRSYGGLLASSTNSGRHTRNRFGFVPELGLNLGYDFTPLIRGFVGYSLIYWSDVIRPGEQFDRAFDTQAVNATRPAVRFDSASLWVQGVSCGLEYRW